MNLSAADLRELADVAIAAATEAAEMIARSRPDVVEHKAGVASRAALVVTEVDRLSEAVIIARLAPTLDRFDLGLLTEERDDDGSRLRADHFWSVDPLDGTLPFIEGIPGSAVSIALVQSDGTPLIGVIVDPTEGTVTSAVAGHGAFRDGQPIELPPRGETLTVFADRSFVARDDHADLLDALAGIAFDIGANGVELHATSGAVMNASGVLTHPPACYFKHPTTSGGGSLWDFAATACIFGEAGLVATDIRGDALDLNRADSTFMHHRGALFATDKELAGRIRALVANPD